MAVGDKLTNTSGVELHGFHPADCKVTVLAEVGDVTIVGTDPDAEGANGIGANVALSAAQLGEWYSPAK